MRGEHERYEQLAVGHVLGGLDAGEAADFRSHLLGCRDCRLRVAELRDLAADLAAAERDERARANVRTEVVRREDRDTAAEPRPAGVGTRHVTVAALVVIVLAMAMAFWNLHLRTSAATYGQVATYRGETLEEFATGIPVATLTEGEIEGLVIVDEDTVAFSLVGVPALRADEFVAVWLVGTPDGDVRASRPVPGEQIDDGTFAGHVEISDAEELVITRESGTSGEGPRGTELLRARLEVPA